MYHSFLNLSILKMLVSPYFFKHISTSILEATLQRHSLTLIKEEKKRGQARRRVPIIGEVKSRDHKKFSKDEAVAFEKKFAEVKKAEKIERAVGFIFSRSGFTAEVDAYCREKGIVCSEDERWLETGNSKSPIVR